MYVFIQASEKSRIFNDRNWQIALGYHQRNNVIEELKLQYNETQNCFEVNAITNVYGYKNACFLSFNDDGIILSFYCECPYCEENSVACGHIGAVILALEDIVPTQFPYYYNPKKEQEERHRSWLENQMQRNSKLFIETFARDSESEFKANLILDKIRLFANISFDRDGISVTYKIGTEKLYVLRNILEFLCAIDDNSVVSYGKNLAFPHHNDAFDDASKAQIEFLRYYYASNFSSYEHSYSAQRKTLHINETLLDDFYTLYSGEASDYCNVTFSENDLEELPLFLEQKDNFYFLSLNLPQATLLCSKKYWYVRKRYTLSRFSAEVSTHCIKIIFALTREQQIAIHKDDIADFCKYVYPSICDYISLDGVSLETLMPERVYLQSYVDVEDNGDISLKVTYHFEDMPLQYVIDEKEESHLDVERVLLFIKEYSDVLDYDKHIAYISEEDDHAYNFLKHGLEYLNNHSEVYISDAVRQLNAPKKASIQVGVQVQNNLLEIDLDSVDIPKEELFAVLKSYRKRKKFHRLKNGDLVFLQSDELQEANDLLTDLHIQPSEFENGHVAVANYHSFELDNFASEAKYTTVKRSKQFEEMMQHITSIEPHTYNLPEVYEPILRDYQKFGYQWLKTMSEYSFGGILADDMGLGKTLQMIAILEDEKSKNNNATSLVICPASLLYNWKDEIAKFSKVLTSICVQGTQATRNAFIMDIKNYDVVITSYDYIRRDYESYANMMFTYIVLDEAQYIKNHTTKNAFAVKQLQGVHRFALTGTPIENSLAELWSIFDFLMPGYLYNYHYFRANYEKEIVKNKNEKIQTKLKKMVEPFILRRLKKDVLKELPDKVENVYYQEFNEEERKIYLANLAQINLELQEKLQMDTMDKFVILAMMTRLRQLCCDARLLYENVSMLSSKLQGCLDILSAAKTSNKKVLLFSSFTSMLELIETELLKENISYLKLTGETKKEDRHAYVESFQHGNYDVFLISLKAGGTGLNLTAAEIVIHFDPWWNMSAQNQATDRAHRIGQTKNLQVYKLIMKDSIEEKILKMQERKMNLADAFIAGNEGSITSMSNEQIMSLFK